MILKCRFFFSFIMVSMILQTSLTHAQQTYQLDWGFNINGTNASLTIEQGDTVEWTWIDTGQHNVINTANAVETFDSGLLQGVGTTFSHTFTEIGVNDYECSPHNGNMFGTITVTAPASNDFYLAPNGVTCMCPNAAVGDSGDPGNGIVYTKRTRNQITPQNAATTCTSGITDMSELFKNEASFNEEISSWDVSSVEFMLEMFQSASTFNQDLSHWDVSSVEDMTAMFKNATSFNQPLNSWETFSLSYCGSMFEGATSFNQPLGQWNVSSVEEMAAMFRNTNFNHDISAWDVSNVTSFVRMFEGATSFNQSLDQWDVSSAIDFSLLFKNATSFNQPLNSWDTFGLQQSRSMFNGASSFNQPLNNWDMSQIENCDDMFKFATNFNQDLSQWEFFSFVNETALQGFVAYSGMDVTNYDLLLESFKDQGIQGMQLISWDIKFCNSSARNTLMNNLGWLIWGDEYNVSSFSAPPPVEYTIQQGECSVSSLVLGEPDYIVGCGPVIVSNDAPSEFFPGSYVVIWTLEDSNGIIYQDAQEVEIIFPVDEADVCYVTADAVSPEKNRIFITSDPSLSGQNVEFHEVLRESPSGSYETIGFIVPPEDSFLDATSDNNTQAYRYKVQTTDVCGQLLNLSDLHKTILLQSNIATDNSVNLAWSPYIGVTFNTYNIYRSVNNANYELLASISSTNTSYNDTSANVLDNFYEYYISIDVASCSTDPFQSFELESNREYINPNLALVDQEWLKNSIFFYPNPSSGRVNVSVSQGIDVTNMTVYSALGQVVLQTSMSQKLDLSSLPAGVYIIKTLTDKGTVSHSLIKQ
jgi:plastocyanin